MYLQCVTKYKIDMTQRSRDQYDSCNSTLGPPVQVLGKCTSPTSKPSIEIQQSSAQLNSSTSFSPDTTVYLTSELSTVIGTVSMIHL